MNVAVICELNPCHNGHNYIFGKARELAGTEGFVVAVMSGNYVQRGEPAIVDKWSRAEAAILMGADAVVEIPSVFAVRSAQFFAEAGVFISTKLGFIDALVFGSESGDIEKLKSLADVDIAGNVGSDDSYARKMAELLGEGTPANDTLGIEYIRALNRLGSNIKPIAVKRAPSSGTIVSATDIRALLTAGDLETPKCCMPDFAYIKTIEKINYYGGPCTLDLFEPFIMAKLLELGPRGISEIPFADDGIENKIYAEAKSGASLETLIKNSTSRHYQSSRIKRILLSTITGARKSNVAGGVPYIRVLAVNESRKQILASVNGSSLPVYVGNFPPSASENEIIRSEILATDLYCLSHKNINARKCGIELSTPLVSTLQLKVKSEE